MKILFIGNSYTYYNDLWDIVKSIYKTQGQDIKVDHYTIGGATLKQLFFEDEESKNIIEDKLNNNKYDYMFIQEQSVRPVIDTNLFIDAVVDINKICKEKNINLILYETWERKEGCFMLDEIKRTSTQMGKELIGAYTNAANIVNCKVSHVGKAFHYINEHHKEIELYFEDKSHPSYEGSLLAAIVHYITLEQKAPIFTTNIFKTTDETLKVLVEVASKIVL